MSRILEAPDQRFCRFSFSILSCPHQIDQSTSRFHQEQLSAARSIGYEVETHLLHLGNHFWGNHFWGIHNRQSSMQAPVWKEASVNLHSHAIIRPVIPLPTPVLHLVDTYNIRLYFETQSILVGFIPFFCGCSLGR